MVIGTHAAPREPLGLTTAHVRLIRLPSRSLLPWQLCFFGEIGCSLLTQVRRGKSPRHSPALACRRKCRTRPLGERQDCRGGSLCVFRKFSGSSWFRQSGVISSRLVIEPCRDTAAGIPLGKNTLWDASRTQAVERNPIHLFFIQPF